MKPIKEEVVLEILNNLIQDIGQQVTRDYEFKGGIWEGMSIDNEKSRQKYSKDILNLLAQTREEAIKECLDLMPSEAVGANGEARGWNDYRDQALANIKELPTPTSKEK